MHCTSGQEGLAEDGKGSTPGQKYSSDDEQKTQKESLFNILGFGYFDGEVMLDMYSGSRAVAIRPSRGWTVRFSIENNRLAQKTIEQNIEITKSRAISFKTTKRQTRT